MKLYYVTDLKNYNEIFSIEYLMPTKIFSNVYNYEKTRWDLYDEYITLYKDIPYIKDNEFVIGLKIKNRRIVPIDNKICISPVNIKLNVTNIFFNNDNIKKIIKGRSLLTSEIKNSDKYFPVFKTLSKNKDSKYFGYNRIKKENIENNIILNTEKKSISIYDKLIGALYYSCLMNKSSIVVHKTIYEIYGKILYLKKIKKTMFEKKLLSRNINSSLLKELNKLKRDLKKELEKKKKTFVNIKNNLYITITNNHKYNLLNDEKVVFNIIINSIVESYNLKESMINIGNELKNSNIKESIILEFRKIYDFIINGNLEAKIYKETTFPLMKSLLIALDKKSSLKEARQLIEKYEIKDPIYIYFFMGLINGYSNMSKIIKREVEKDKICKVLIQREIMNINNLTYNYYKKLVYKKIMKLRLEKNLYKIRQNQILEKNKSIKIKNINNRIINIFIFKGKYKFVISLNTSKKNSFDTEIESLNLINPHNIRYNSFDIFVIKKDKKKKLNKMEYCKLLNSINKVFYLKE